MKKLIGALILTGILGAVLLIIPPSSVLIVSFFILLAAGYAAYLSSIFCNRTYQILTFCFVLSFLSLLYLLGFQPIITGLLILFFMCIGFLLKH